jgi:hypothetical protein
VGLAARGARRLGDEAERIVDRAELSRVRRQAWIVYFKAVTAGAMMTVIALLI